MSYGCETDVPELLKVESPIQTGFDTLGLNSAKVSTVACFPLSREDPVPLALSLGRQLPCAVPVLAGEAARCLAGAANLEPVQSLLQGDAARSRER